MRDIQIYEKPRHRSVIRTQNIVRDWQLRNIPLCELDQAKPVDTAVEEYLKGNGDILADFLDFQGTVETYQTIMLATTLTLREIQQLDDEVESDEFDAFVERCRDAIGGGASDFFDTSRTDSASVMTMTDTAEPSTSTT